MIADVVIDITRDNWYWFALGTYFTLQVIVGLVYHYRFVGKARRYNASRNIYEDKEITDADMIASLLFRINYSLPITIILLVAEIIWVVFGSITMPILWAVVAFLKLVAMS